MYWILDLRCFPADLGEGFPVDKGNTGIIEITVDGGEPVKIDGYFAADWGGGFAEWQLAVKGLKPGLHTVRVKLLEEKNKKNAGNNFRFMALTAAGQ